jgi:Ni,Fe-hydrogenase III large subunit
MLRNGDAMPLRNVPLAEIGEFGRSLISGGGRLAALFGKPWAGGKVRLFAVLVHAELGGLRIVSTEVRDRYPSLTPVLPQAHLFEREIHEQCGVTPEGHPWLKPVRFPPTPEGKPGGVGEMDFYRVEGEEIHEVAVGPVHAGIIEPGHFRFQCHGEEVLHLEISLGYQHRGVERALAGGPHPRTVHQMETLAGDTTVGHASAYAGIVEALSEVRVPPRALALRAVALELERLANHAGDLGALASDVGFLPTASYCGRLRGEYLNLTAALCGSRFGRGLVRPGGTGFDADPALVGNILERLRPVARDTEGAVNLLWETSSVVARFEETGPVSKADAEALGLVGPAARACGLERDVRQDLPWGLYRFAQIPISTMTSGDVFARAQVRWMEIQRSAKFVREQLGALPRGGVRETVGPLAPDSVAVSLVEGWRGEICHVAITDGKGCFAAYKVVDPSFRNWRGLALSLRGQEISDFPLCNKSFNLSYCGFDL